MIRSRFLISLPMLITLGICVLLLLHGPVPQIANYNQFADQSVLFGVPHAGNVLSNIGFAIVGVWGWMSLGRDRAHPALRDGWSGYRLFLIGLVLTAIGSAYYHLAPDNDRIVWDRLGIALISAGLLGAVRAETRKGMSASLVAAGLVVYGVLSVSWWSYTDHLHGGPGDMRPFILLELSPLVLIPLWQAIYRSPRADRIGYACALLLYVGARVTEFNDRALYVALGGLSGHTLKHLLATAAAAVIVVTLRYRLPGSARA